MNKILNKIISLILALLICSGLLTVSPTFADGSNEDKAALQAMEVLRQFGIIPEDYYDYNVNMNQGVSRADFAAAAANLINLTYADDSGVYYYDVPQTHWAFHAINALTVQGVLNGHGNRLFRPDDVIEKNEAYKLLVTILGYGDFAEYNGGYPSGYFTAAKQAGITNGLSSETQVTRRDMFLMLYNAMTAKVLEPTNFGEKSATYHVSENQSLLSIYRDIYYDKGTVTGANSVELSGAVIGGNQVIIDETDYTSDLPMAEYLGEEIEFFYHCAENTDDRNILWAESTGRTKSLNITADYDTSFDKASFTLTYIDANSGRKRQVTLARNIVVVYNGGVVSSNIDDIFNEPRYTAKLINSGSGYDIAIVKAYENILVSSKDAASLTVYDKITPGKQLVLDENLYENMILQSAGGIDTVFGDIAANHVLSVYLSKDGRYLEVQVSANQVSGNLDMIRKDDHGYTLVIGGNGYFMPDNGKVLGINPGDNVTLYLDTMGEVADYEYNLSSDTLYAWILQYKIEDNFDTSILKLRMYTENNKMVVADAARNVNIDGAVCKTAESARAALALGNGNVAEQLVRVKLKDGEVKYIDTVNKGSEESGLFVSSPFASNTYMGSLVLGPKIRANNSTKVFVIPQSNKYKTEAEAYNVTTVSAFFSTWTAYTAEGYQAGENKVGFTDAIVVKEDLLGTAKRIAYAGIMIVSGESMVWDEESGTAVQQLVAQSGKSVVEYKCADGYFLESDPNIKKGNVITITTNKKGELTSTTLLYGTTKGETPTEKKDSRAVSNWTAENQTACGYITGLNNGLATLALEPGGETVLLMPTNVGVAVYDPRQSESVFAGSEGDLADAMANNYRVVLGISRGTMRSFAVVKE